MKHNNVGTVVSPQVLTYVGLLCVTVSEEREALWSGKNIIYYAEIKPTAPMTAESSNKRGRRETNVRTNEVRVRRSFEE